MRRKIGEMQVQANFSKILADKLRLKFGDEAVLAEGHFAGKQDKAFADYFAGTESVNILIEFKEFESEARAELVKSARHSMCLNISNDLSILSGKCHYIGWKVRAEEVEEVEFYEYLGRICPMFDDCGRSFGQKRFSEKKFIDGFIRGKIGLDVEKFKVYVDYLYALLKKPNSVQSEAPFSAFLYSRDSDGKLRTTTFHSLSEFGTMLLALKKSTPSKRSSPKVGSSPTKKKLGRRNG